ncbi:N-formylglutamate amidohydrolase [Sphingosinithalassobacter tenebrarum]|uniref:N-formylglutamate amidohydrolase n=1 Tax=Stakelama tenebrarum TaxID=2711215 RepID=A0A6G6YAP8_9SPHN|nr:N-formylglutamate amidohydrolase [Sphingosinithalassobacter tenebrarum]
MLSVPHAGRDYPLALRAALRVPVESLRALEDRHVDAVARGAHGQETLLIARRARAWIDLNRAEDERDPQLDDGARSSGRPLSAKLRSGLGLVPRRAANADIWRRRLSDAEVRARIAGDHRPYHAALHDALAAAHARFGVAVLIDVHSMPPIGAIDEAPRIVFGDRYGKSAAPHLIARLQGVTHAHGTTSAVNTPYPGGHILQRHGDPRRGIHAVQIEIDRTLYLDGQLDQPGPGADRTVALLRDMIAAISDAVAPHAIAAE